MKLPRDKDRKTKKLPLSHFPVFVLWGRCTIRTFVSKDETAYVDIDPLLKTTLRSILNKKGEVLSMCFSFDRPQDNSFTT